MTRGNEPVTIEDVMNSETAEGALRKDTQGTLQMLAEETGGFLVANSNNLAERLERVSSDLDAYYEIAYTPVDHDLRRPVPQGRGEGRSGAASTCSRAAATSRCRRPTARRCCHTRCRCSRPRPPRRCRRRSASARRRSGSARRRAACSTPCSSRCRSISSRSRRTASEKKYALRFTVMALVRNDKDEIVERLSDSFPLEGPLERVEALKRGRLVFKRQVWLAPGRTRCWPWRATRRRSAPACTP